MSEITAKLAAAKLNDQKGVSDDLAAKMFHTLGSHHVAIVDLQVVDRTEGVSEKQIVRLALDQLEIMEGPAADHCRDLMRAAYQNRSDQLPLDGDDMESSDEIIARGKAVLLTCQTCLHPNTDQRIRHYQGDNPEDENAWCTWSDDGTHVDTDDDSDQHGASGSATSDQKAEVRA